MSAPTTKHYNAENVSLLSLISHLDQWVDNMLNDYRSRLNADDLSAAVVAARVAEFKRQIRAVATFDHAQQIAAFAAINSALAIGCMFVASPTVADGVARIIRTSGTQPARASRRRNDIKEIVEKHADSHLARNPKDTAGKTALAIFNRVIRDVVALPKVPKEWVVKDAGNLSPEEKKRVVENIRGQLRRLRTNDKNPEV